jgi:hypothetical protein
MKLYSLLHILECNFDEAGRHFLSFNLDFVDDIMPVCLAPNGCKGLRRHSQSHRIQSMQAKETYYVGPLERIRVNKVAAKALALRDKCQGNYARHET